MTSVHEIQQLVDEYQRWLKDRTSLKSVGPDWVEITTPFLDRHNDCVQLYVRKVDGGYRLSDDGYTLRDLEISGCPINTPKRKSMLSVALNGYGVEEDKGELLISATAANFPIKKHALTQAVLAVNDLFYTSSATVRSLFKEDVEAWLRLEQVRFLSGVTFIGQSGYPHQFDFAIPQSDREPERLLKSLANPNKDVAELLMFAWLDSSSVRPPAAEAFAVLNDTHREVNSSVVDALTSYQISPILWSKRSEFVSRLAA